ncbi:hypothetical protein [Carboxylicivirga marina]|uniref:Lipoprotein n=1 Tax=Carboxylicivirga marina TaxID=2800988 RepID=A0ABS1HG66_9BACT|nr:hypothetical protein [Carboxylicivirga marina]MBK3516629.1 hypothetical protein [Carboxylicivirga marina]
MKKILVVLAVAAMVVSSCGMKTNAQGEDAKEKTAVEATTEVPAEKACCPKDAAQAEACCDKDSTECTDAEKKACCDKDKTADAAKADCEEKCDEACKKECEKKEEA